MRITLNLDQTGINMRSRILAALVKVLAKASISDLERMSKDIINRFFPELPTPKFKIVHNATPKWLGRCSVLRKEKNGVEYFDHIIEVQKSIIDDEKTLHRILAHELIHYWQHQDLEKVKNELSVRRRFRPNPHGKSFQEIAGKMNAVYGKDYVTTTSDLSYVVNQEKQFYIIIQPHGKKFGATKAVQLSAKQKEEIKRRIVEQQAHIFKTNDRDFHRVANIEMYEGFSIFKDDDIQNKLKEIYENSDNIDSQFLVSK